MGRLDPEIQFYLLQIYGILSQNTGVSLKCQYDIHNELLLICKFSVYINLFIYLKRD